MKEVNKMLLKLMKHDFIYSAKLFFALGAIAIAMAIILGAGAIAEHAAHQQQIVAQGYQPNISPLPTGIGFNVAFMMSSIFLIPVAMAAIIHIAQFYRKSMFGRVGHLTMTMPIGRGTLLASKIAVSFVWFIYTVGIAIVMAIIFSLMSPYRPWNLGQLLRLTFNLADIATLGVNTATIAFAAIALLFFCVTLSHSVFKGKRVNGFLAGLFGLFVAWPYAAAANAMVGRFIPRTERIFTDSDGVTHTFVSMSEPLTGLRYGRIVIGQMAWGWTDGVPTDFRDVYIDVFFIAFTLAVAAIIITATHYLLKKRVST